MTPTLIFIAEAYVCSVLLFYSSVLLDKKVESTPNAPWYVHVALRVGAATNLGRASSLSLSIWHARPVLLDIGAVVNTAPIMLIFGAGLVWIVRSRLPGASWRKVYSIRDRFADLAHNYPHGKALAALAATACFVAAPGDRPEDVRRPDESI